MTQITPAMAAALATFQDMCPKIDLDGEVKFKEVKFKYATLGNIIEKIKPAMKAGGLSFSQTIGTDGIRTLLICKEDGSFLESLMAIPGSNDPKQIGGQITYYRRYMLVAILGIVGDDDKDAPEAKPEGKPRCTEQHMAALIKKVIAGEDVLEKAMNAFGLTADQIRTLVNAEPKAEKPE